MGGQLWVPILLNPFPSSRAGMSLHLTRGWGMRTPRQKWAEGQSSAKEKRHWPRGLSAGATGEKGGRWRSGA